MMAVDVAELLPPYAPEVFDAILDDVVRRMLRVARPKRIILFGSAAKGAMGPDSDFDFLVVMPDDTPLRQVEEDLYRSLWGLGIAKDVVVVTESEVQRHGNDFSRVILPALREGRVLYSES